MKRTLKGFIHFTILLFVISLTACGGSNGTTPSGAGTGDNPNLSADDYPDVGVCLTGSTDVTNSTFVAALAALTEFTFVHLPYSSDADIPFICGKQGTWDPSDANAFSAFNPDIPISALITDVIQNSPSGGLGFVMICNSGFAFAQSNFGFHDATTWRGELFFEVGGRIYRMRVRFTVSGNDAGKSLADVGVNAADLKLLDAGGNELVTIQDVLALFANNAGSVSVQLVSNGTVHLTALGRVICWEDVTP